MVSCFPSHAFETRNALKLPRVCGDERRVEAARVRGDELIERADRCSFFFQGRAELAVVLRGILLEWKVCKKLGEILHDANLFLDSLAFLRAVK